MNSFTLTAVGNLARNPEAVAKGATTYTRFCLVGTDYAGKDDDGTPREMVTSIWFVAFGSVGESVVRHARKGDQLIVEARVRTNAWIGKQGEKQYGYDFVVDSFRFGAPGKLKREEREARRGEGLHGEGRANGHANGAHINDASSGGANLSDAYPDSMLVDGADKEGGAGTAATNAVGGAAGADAAASVTGEKPRSGRGRRAAPPP